MFENPNKYFNADELNLVRQTGFYPYEVMDGLDKCEYTTLPPNENFYSSLRLSGISNTNYSHALNVYYKFNVLSF